MDGGELKGEGEDGGRRGIGGIDLRFSRWFRAKVIARNNSGELKGWSREVSGFGSFSWWFWLGF